MEAIWGAGSTAEISGIKGHSFLTGVCGVRGLARASQSFHQELIRAEWAPLKAGIVFHQRSLSHEPCGDTEGPEGQRAPG